MKLTTEQLIQLLNNSSGGVTFERCGLDKEKNFLEEEEHFFVESDDEIYEYCVNMLGGCPFSKCAIFTVKLDGKCACAIKFNWDDFDFFDLPEDWHYWNLNSFVDEFDLSNYGLLAEVKDGEWRVVIE